MTYEAWAPLFLGMVLSMLLANSVQWFMYRERIYGIYSLYTLVWAVYFTVNYFKLPYNLANLHKVWLSYTGYILYLELAKIFLELRRFPQLLRWVKVVQGLLLSYILFKTYIYVFTDFWRTDLHQWLLHPVRLSLLSVGAYIVVRFIRSKDVVARFFVAGTASLLINHAITTVMLIRSPNLSLQLPFWQHPDLFVQTGVVLDLIFFALGISYRHRREAVRKAVVEQQLAREREQHHRQQLEAALTLQQLKQENTDVQMRALQSQINPHFLFNSLNSLSSLIADEPKKAEEFVDEMSSVYRYLLRSNEGELATLSMELTFIQSYFHLLRTRHGAAIHLHIAVDPALATALLPPLTLQLLVENAVKHNIILPEQPIHIYIQTTSDGALVVENTLQRKKLRVESNRVGLSNIGVKYRLLGQSEPHISEEGGWFRVKLALLHPQRQPTSIPLPATPRLG